MADTSVDVPRAHRWFAVECNNRTWDLLEKGEWTLAERDEMVDMAHAARWHWSQVGTSVNTQRALVLLAEVHAALGDGPAALAHAQRCWELTPTLDELEDFDRAAAAACLARAHAAAGNAELAREFRQQAQTAGDAIQSEEDREVFNQILARGNWFGV